MPTTLVRGEDLEIGLARIELNNNGVLVVEDPYGREELIVNRDRVVVGLDYPLNRPRRLTDCLVIEYEKPLVAEKTQVWIYAPIELAVFVGRSVIAHLTPVKAKYCLHGELVGGKICRYYKSRVFTKEPMPQPGLALLKVRYSLSEPLKVPYVVLHGESLDIYITRNGGIYYSMVDATGGKTIILYKITSSAPKHGVKRVKRSNHLKPRTMTFRVSHG